MLTAIETQENDERKKKFLETKAKKGYVTLYTWENNYRKNRELVIELF